jgi:hypothetical protein
MNKIHELLNGGVVLGQSFPAQGLSVIPIISHLIPDRSSHHQGGRVCRSCRLSIFVTYSMKPNT